MKCCREKEKKKKKCLCPRGGELQVFMARLSNKSSWPETSSPSHTEGQHGTLQPQTAQQQPAVTSSSGQKGQVGDDYFSHSAVKKQWIRSSKGAFFCFPPSSLIRDASSLLSPYISLRCKAVDAAPGCSPLVASSPKLGTPVASVFTAAGALCTKQQSLKTSPLAKPGTYSKQTRSSHKDLLAVAFCPVRLNLGCRPPGRCGRKLGLVQGFPGRFRFAYPK